MSYIIKYRNQINKYGGIQIRKYSEKSIKYYIKEGDIFTENGQYKYGREMYKKAVDKGSIEATYKLAENYIAIGCIFNARKYLKIVIQNGNSIEKRAAKDSLNILNTHVKFACIVGGSTFLYNILLLLLIQL